MDELISLLAVTSEEERKAVIALDSTRGGVHKVGESLLDGKASNGRDNSVPFRLKAFEIGVGTVVVVVPIIKTRGVDGVVNNLYFIGRDIVLRYG